MINILDKLFTNSKYLFQPLTSPERITTSNSFWQHLQNNCIILWCSFDSEKMLFVLKIVLWNVVFYKLCNYIFFICLHICTYTTILELFWLRFKMSLIRNIEILLLHYKVCNSGIIKMKWKGSLNFTVQLIPNQSICDVKYWI